MKEQPQRQVEAPSPDPLIAIGTGLAAIGLALALEADRLGLVAVAGYALLGAGLFVLSSRLLQRRAQQRRQRELAVVLVHLAYFMTAARDLRSKGGDLTRYVQSLGIEDPAIRQSLLQLLDAMTAHNRTAALPPPN